MKLDYEHVKRCLWNLPDGDQFITEYRPEMDMVTVDYPGRKCGFVQLQGGEAEGWKWRITNPYASRFAELYGFKPSAEIFEAVFRAVFQPTAYEADQTIPY